MSQKTRDGLTRIYGPELGIQPPKRIDSTMLRRALEAAPAMAMLAKTDEFLRDDRYTSMMGPVMGRISSANKYDDDAQAWQAHIYAANQVVGKFLEGGVLRAEDVPKYANMLPNLNDTPDVARRKNAGMSALIKGLQETYRSNGGLPVSVPPFDPMQIDVPALNMWLLDNPAHPMFNAFMEIYDSRMTSEDDEDAGN